MNTVKIDFTQIPSREPVSEGSHNAVVSKVEFRANSDPSKHPYLSWTYEVADGPDAGKTVYDMTSLAPQALWRLAGIVHVLTGEELDSVEFTYDDTGTVVLPRFAGRPVQIEVIHEEYDGRSRARVNAVAAPKTKLVKNPVVGQKVLK